MAFYITANMLFSLYYTNFLRKKIYRCCKIRNAIKNKTVYPRYAQYMQYKKINVIYVSVQY